MGVKQQIAFYGSTPAYRPVLEAHGWGDLQTELNTLSKQGEWVEMGNRIGDEIVDAFAVVSEPADVAKGILSRFGDVIDRVSFYAPAGLGGDVATQLLSELRGATART